MKFKDGLGEREKVEVFGVIGGGYFYMVRDNREEGEEWEEREKESGFYI